MDVRYPDAEPTVAEVEALDSLLGVSTVSEGWQRDLGGVHRAADMRSLLLPALHALNDRIGFISQGGLGELSRRLDVAPAEAYGVASFYSLFSLEPVAPRTVHVCIDLACALVGGDRLLEETASDSDGSVRIIQSPCLGMCEQAPAALVSDAGLHAHEAAIGRATAVSIRRAAKLGAAAFTDETPIAAAVPQAGNDGLSLLKRLGVVDPLSIDDYRRTGGYEALRRAVAIGAARVIDEVTASKLVGRGGAAFPAGRKWAAVASQPARPKYLVCNADESEPGTFKDRVVMEGDPFAVIESMTIAAFATGCEQGYIYLRGEYPRARRHLLNAIAVARSRRLLGDNIMDAGFTFDIQVFRGAGAYICGEETAIFNSIEGYRGEPRSKPPFPVEAGLFAKPTLVNNVETLVNVLPIILGGGDAFAAVGTDGSAGTKLFCVSGSVAAPGVYEVPFGATLAELLIMAGGFPGPAQLRGVLLGGAAGGFVRPDQIDLPLTFEGARAAGATLGSGVVLVVDSAADISALLRRIAAFFRDESCGQCVPCRVGTVRQEEIVHRLTIGPRRDGDLALLAEVGQVMKDASICGLGQTASSAIESAIQQLGALS